MFLTPHRPRPHRPNASEITPTAAPLGSSEATVNEQVLSALKVLQEQVAQLQATQRESHAPSSKPGPKRLPKEIKSAVHSAVKHLKERAENPMTWDTSLSFIDPLNKSVTDQVKLACSDEKFTTADIHHVARTYFLTLKRRSRICNIGKMEMVHKKQRSIQRRHNKVHSRSVACSQSTTLTAEEKKKWTSILKVEYMSSEDTGSESGSDSEESRAAQNRKVFLNRPLPWRSELANEIMTTLDRKSERRRSQRAKEMCRKRCQGEPSSRGPPTDAPSWAVH